MNDLPRPVLIGIGGASGAGKSALADALCNRLGLDLSDVIPLDAYYRDHPELELSVRSQLNFDTPDAIEWTLLRGQLQTLHSGKPVQRPDYDYASHRRSPTTVTVDPVRFLLLEGVLALYDEPVRRLLQACVYVEADDALCLQRRIERDVRERGRSRASVMEQYNTTVRPMFDQYVFPTRAFADVIISGDQPLARSADEVVHLLSG